jgi:hypothetical protein
MNKRLLLVLFLGLLLTGCQMRFGGNRLGGAGRGTALPATTPTSLAADLPTAGPTHTPRPAPTLTPTPLPDLAVIGLPSETAGTTAYDFTAGICTAEWYTSAGSVPCNSTEETSTSGYVALLDGLSQGLPAEISGLLTYPPYGGASDTISGKYPAFTVQKGDRFRAVLTCRAHNFCDVEFGLDYFDANGRSSLKRWSYLFTNPPIVVDYPLDGIAGLTVRFNLSVRRHGEGLQDYAAWLEPHIYRP